MSDLMIPPSGPLGPALPNQGESGGPSRVPPRGVFVQNASGALQDKGGQIGKLFVNLPGNPLNLDRVRFAAVDFNLPGRVMYPFDPETGKAVTGGDNNKPICGSSDGKVPRQVFWGKTYRDWRGPWEVTINERAVNYVTGEDKVVQGCQGCPLGEWHQRRDKLTNAVIKDADGNTRQKPPCAPTETYVLWLLDYHLPIIVQASSFSVLRAFQGQPRQNIRGLKHYYLDPVKLIGKDANGNQIWSRPVWDGEHNYAMIMEIDVVKNDYGGRTYVPKFSVDPQPMTDEEANEFAQALHLYQQPDPETGYTLRELLTGEAYAGRGDSDDPFSPQNVSIDTDAARRHLGNTGSRRIGDDDAPF